MRLGMDEERHWMVDTYSGQHLPRRTNPAQSWSNAAAKRHADHHANVSVHLSRALNFAIVQEHVIRHKEHNGDVSRPDELYLGQGICHFKAERLTIEHFKCVYWIPCVLKHWIRLFIHFVRSLGDRDIVKYYFRWRPFWNSRWRP